MDATTLHFLSVSIAVAALAAFLGFELISKVPTILHTPLTSGSNAISGVILFGAIYISHDAHGLELWFALAAVCLATVNVVGGFVVTDRMLAMFKSKKAEEKR